MEYGNLLIGDDRELLCPECGYDCTHLESIEEYREKDDRLCVKLHFSCEAGHNFVLDFHQHEGITYFNDITFQE